MLFRFDWTKVLLKVIGFFRKRMVNMFYVRQRAEIGLNGVKVMISTLKTKNVQESRKNLKM